MQLGIAFGQLMICFSTLENIAASEMTLLLFRDQLDVFINGLERAQDQQVVPQQVQPAPQVNSQVAAHPQHITAQASPQGAPANAG